MQNFKWVQNWDFFPLFYLKFGQDIDAINLNVFCTVIDRTSIACFIEDINYTIFPSCLWFSKALFIFKNFWNQLFSRFIEAVIKTKLLLFLLVFGNVSECFSKHINHFFLKPNSNCFRCYQFSMIYFHLRSRVYPWE